MIFVITNGLSSKTKGLTHHTGHTKIETVISIIKNPFAWV